MYRNHFIFITYFFFCFFCQKLSAQTWQPLPMYGGGFITDLVPHPTDPSVLVGVCDVGGVFITADDCQNWTSLTANVPKTDFRNFHARSFAFDPQTPTTMYYVSGDAPYSSTGKIWKTINSGSSWTSVNLPVNISGNGSARYAGSILLVNPLTTNKLYVGGQPTYNYTTGTYNTDGGLATSNDNGATWSKIGGSTFDKTWITKLRFAPNDPSVLYISAIQSSLNGNTTVGTGLWQYNTNTAILTQLTTDEVLDFDFDAVATSTIITTSPTANRVSTNGGATWSPLSTPTGLQYGLFATAHPTQTGVWYFGTFSFGQNTIVTTTDAGATWQQVKYSGSSNASKIQYPSYLATNNKPSFGNYMACLLLRSNKAYLSDWYGVWRTDDAASPLTNTAAAATANANWTWTFYAKGIQNMVQVRTSLHPTDPNRFFCNVADLHFYESRDAGATMLYDVVAPMNMTTRIDFFEANPSIGYMAGTAEHGDFGRLYKTTNGGTTWSKATTFFDTGAKNITDLQLTKNADTLIVGIEKNTLPAQVYRSNDGGATWIAWDNGLTTNNTFKTWDKNDRLLRDADGETFYIWRDNNAFRRKLTDAAWTKLTLPVNQTNWISGVQTSRTQSRTLFLAQYTTALYKSTDNGTTWIPLSTPSNVGTFALSPSQDNIVFQSWNGANEHILYQSPNGGSTWTPLNTNGFWRMIDGLTFLNNTRLIGWTGGNSAFVTNLASPVIPLELIDFQGFNEGKSNHLTWHFADTKDLKSIEIQKSVDGKNFTPLSIKSKNVVEDTDNTPFEVTYYRLKMTELNGNTHFSKTIAVKRFDTEGGKIKVYPNPVNAILTIENAEGKDVEIVNALGQVVLSEKNSQHSSFNIHHLESGVYFLKIEGQTIRFIKN
jgi:photosystem II stability/assembly factor-like uncharacterized protein